jgi:hypothetical protein
MAKSLTLWPLINTSGVNILSVAELILAEGYRFKAVLKFSGNSYGLSLNPSSMALNKSLAGTKLGLSKIAFLRASLAARELFNSIWARAKLK